MINLFRALYFTFMWVRAVRLNSDRRFEEAYQIILRLSKRFKARQAKLLVMRGYLAAKTKRYEDSAASIEAFFSLIEESGSYNSQEKKYLQIYAAVTYLRIWNDVDVHLHDVTEIEELAQPGLTRDFSQVRDTLKSDFPLEFS